MFISFPTVHDRPAEAKDGGTLFPRGPKSPVSSCVYSQALSPCPVIPQLLLARLRPFQPPQHTADTPSSSVTASMTSLSSSKHRQSSISPAQGHAPSLGIQSPWPVPRKPTTPAQVTGPAPTTATPLSPWRRRLGFKYQLPSSPVCKPGCTSSPLPPPPGGERSFPTPLRAPQGRDRVRCLDGPPKCCHQPYPPERRVQQRSAPLAGLSVGE